MKARNVGFENRAVCDDCGNDTFVMSYAVYSDKKGYYIFECADCGMYIGKAEAEGDEDASN